MLVSSVGACSSVIVRTGLRFRASLAEMFSGFRVGVKIILSTLGSVLKRQHARSWDENNEQSEVTNCSTVRI